jgi:methylglutaconyl-CoA hydratase
MPVVVTDLDPRGVANITLNRPEAGNAYDSAVIEGLLAAMDELGAKPGLRAVVLKGSGRHFQAGADLKWIRGVSAASLEENVRVSGATAQAIDRLNRLPVPTVALVHGGCFGGGTGMVAACDVAIAADNAVFSISEVRWGLTAAIIIPQLSDAISARQLRRYALTGERFDAAEARRIGLVHHVVPPGELAAAGEAMVAQLLQNGPQAMAETKAWILKFAWGGFDRSTFEAFSQSHGATRRTPEAAEGLASFAEKRAANWGGRRAD